MRYYLDTEFHERPHTIELISIAVVAENGREFYCESSDYNRNKSTEWLKKNVLPNLWFNKKPGVKFSPRLNPVHGIIGGEYSRKDIGEELLDFIGDDTPEFWGYFSDYDWVVTCWLFGPMIALPKKFPMYCRDIVQLRDSLYITESDLIASLPEHELKHHALSDARWNKLAHEQLMLVAES